MIIYQIVGLLVAMIPVYLSLWKINRNLGEIQGRLNVAENRMDRIQQETRFQNNPTQTKPYRHDIYDPTRQERSEE